MSDRRTLGAPITLGVTMIVLIIALTISWVVLAVRQALSEPVSSGWYWTLLTVGSIFFALVLVGVILYLSITIKAYNLNQRQSNFVDAVTHELKSPIASLKLYLQTLSRHQVSQSQQADFHRFMLEDVERLDGLINHLLDAARLEQAPRTDDGEEVELRELLRHSASLVALRYHVPPETFAIRVPPAVVHARLGDLEMVFRNLLDNAVKYGGQPPQVEVEGEFERPDRITVRVADNGPGVPPVQRRKIFRRFVRLGNELERVKPGTGLGLYIVRTQVQRLRGRVRVRDRLHQSGTVFEVQLPARQPARPSEATPAQQGAS